MTLIPEWTLYGGMALAAAGGIAIAMRTRTGGDRKQSVAAAAQDEAGAVSVVWRREYATGNPTIDEQHQQLFRSASVLLNALAAGDAQSVILPSLERLFRDIRQHFATEEAILEKLGHPDLETHRSHHAKLLQRGEELLAGYRAGSMQPREVFSWVAYDMVAMHISRDDWALFGFKS